MGRLLIAVGLLIAGIGALVSLGLPLGRLPGDLVLRRGSVTIHVPIATCVVVSLVLTFVLTLMRRQ